MATVRDILVRLRGESSDFQRALREARSDLDAFGRSKSVATAEFNVTPFQQAVDRARRELNDFGRLTTVAEADLEISKAKTQLYQLHTLLDDLDKETPSPEVDVQITKALLDINRVERRLEDLTQRRTAMVDIDVDRDRRGSGLGAVLGGVAGAGATAARGIGAAVTSLGLFTRGALMAFPVLAQFTRGLTAMGMSASSVGLIFLALLPVAIAAFTAAVIALTVTLGTLVASFVAAAMAAGMMALALGGVLGAGLLVVVAAFARLAKVMEAVEEREERAADQARAVRDAQQAQARAADNLAEAQRRVGEAAVEAYRAWRDAIEDVDDALLALEGAELNQDQAELNFRRAKEELADFRKESGLMQESLDNLFSKFTDIDYQPEDLIGAIRGSEAAKRLESSGQGGSMLDMLQLIQNVREADHARKVALDGVEDATTRVSDAEARRMEFMREGINAYEPYRAAVRGVRTAQDGLRDATERVNVAVEKQNEALKELTPRERRLVDVIVRLKKELTDLFRPATNRIAAGLLDLLESISDLAKDRGIRRGFREIGDAIGDSFRILGRELGRRETRTLFRQLTTAAAGLVRVFNNEVLREAFRLVMRIASVALPLAVDLLRDVARAFGNWARGVSRSDVADYFDKLVEHFRSWRRLAQAVWGLVKRLFDYANPEGQKLVEKIAKLVEDWNRWLDKNPDKVRDFLHDAREFTEDIAGFIKDAATFAWELYEAAKKVKDAWSWISDVDVEGRPGPAWLWSPEALQDALGDLLGLQSGGVVPGSGAGDRTLARLEAGEFVVRRNIAAAIGYGRLHSLNAGTLPVAASAGRGGIHIDNINLPPAPGHDQLGDPRHQAALLAAELRRRGGGRVG